MSARGHVGNVPGLAVRADGARILTGGEDGTVRTWSRSRLEPLATATHGEPVRAVAFLGQRAISCGDHHVCVFSPDLELDWSFPVESALVATWTDRQRFVVTSVTGTVGVADADARSVRWSPLAEPIVGVLALADGRIAIASHGAVACVRPETGEVVRRTDLSQLGDGPVEATRIRAHPDGRRVVWWCGTIAMEIYPSEVGGLLDPATGEIEPFAGPNRWALEDGRFLALDSGPAEEGLVRLVTRNLAISALAPIPGDRSAVVTTDREGALREWSLDAPPPVADSGHLVGAVGRLQGEVATYAVDTGTLMRWSADDGRLLGQSRLEYRALRHVEVRADGAAYVTWAADSARAWLDVLDREGRPVWTPCMGEPECSAPTLGPDGRHAAFVRPRRWVEVYDPARATRQWLLTDHRSWGTAVRLPDGAVLTGDHDGAIRCWDLATGTKRFGLDQPREVLAATSLPGTTKLAMLLGPAGSRHSFHLLDYETGELGAPVWLPDPPITALTLIARDADLVLAPTAPLATWNVRTGTVTVVEATRGAYTVRVDAEGRRAVMVGHDRSLHRVDLGTGSVTAIANVRTTASATVEFAGHRVVTDTPDGALAVIDLDAARLERTLDGGSPTIAFATDRTRALAALRDGSVRLWSLDDGSELARFKGVTATVWHLGFLDRDHATLLGADTGGAEIWRGFDLASGAVEERRPRNVPNAPAPPSASCAVRSYPALVVVDTIANRQIGVVDGPFFYADATALDHEARFAYVRLLTNSYLVDLRARSVIALGAASAHTPAFSNGELVLVGPSFIRWLDPPTGRELRRLDTPNRTTWTSTSGQCAIATADGEIRVVRSAETLDVLLVAGAAAIRALAFSDDGTLLASGSEAGEVAVWDVERRQAIGRWTSTEPIRSVAVPSRGRVAVVDARGVFVLLAHK